LCNPGQVPGGRRRSHDANTLEDPVTVPADLAKLLDKAYEDKTLTEVLAAPVSALAGVSDGDADHLKQAFNIKSVADLGKSKAFAAAHALAALAELGAK